jgi:hypothetical protein
VTLEHPEEAGRERPVPRIGELELIAASTPPEGRFAKL